jgi:hypothetical protein
MNKSPGHARAIIYQTVTFWIILLGVGVAAVILEELIYGIYALIGGIIILCLFPSLCLSRLSFRQWWSDIVFGGVRNMAYSMSKLSRSSEDKVQCWEPLFAFYFSFTIKYFIPCVLWVLLA